MQNLNYVQDVELAVLGDLTVWFSEVRAKIASISPDDFNFPPCKALFKAICAYAETGEQTLDYVSLPDEMDGVALQPIARYAMTRSCTSMNFDQHVAVLKTLSFDRRVKGELTRLATAHETIRLGELQELVDAERDKDYAFTWVDKAHAQLSAFIDEIGKPIRRIKTGFPVIDGITGGLRMPSVMIIGAAPSVGKTAFSLNIVARQPMAAPVVFFSLEMSVASIYERLIAASRGIDYNLFNTRNFTPKQENEIREAARELHSLPLYVFDNVYDVETQSAIIANIKPELVVVDYVQKVRTTQKTDSRRDEIDKISGMYKQIANYNSCVIIVLSQITRSDRMAPTMSSLKESGGLEADGDYVFMLNRPYALKKNDSSLNPEDATLLLDKNKYGKTGQISMRFDLQHQLFCEVGQNNAGGQYKSRSTAWNNRKKATDDDDILPFS